jgi:hypothetical protein
LAEALAEQRINAEGVAEPVSISEVLTIRVQVLGQQGNDVYTRWARWFFADRSTRAISPAGALTVPQYVQRRIEENTVESLQEAVRLSPTNGLAIARLAIATLKQDSTQNPRRMAEADWASQDGRRH